MKTEQEIREIKLKIEQKIKAIQTQISDVCELQYPTPSLDRLFDTKRQLMAQYNVLHEVLK